VLECLFKLLCVGVCWCVLVQVLLYVGVFVLGVRVHVFSSYKDASQIGLGPPLRRPHFQMHSHFQIFWFRVSTYEFRRNTTEPIMRHHDSLSHLPLKSICNLLDLLKTDFLLTDGRLLHTPNLMSG